MALHEHIEPDANAPHGSNTEEEMNVTPSEEDVDADD